MFEKTKIDEKRPDWPIKNVPTKVEKRKLL